MISPRTRNSEPTHFVCCVAIGLFIILGSLIPYRGQTLSEFHWTTVCPYPTNRRILHGHGHAHGHYSSHAAHYYTRGQLSSSLVRVSAPAAALIVGFPLVDSHRYTHIYGCGSFQYNTTDTFFMTHYSNRYGPVSLSSCVDSFNTSRTSDIWIIYPVNGSVSLSSCGHNFTLNSTFQFYKDVIVDNNASL